jgi:hypothetical protein
MSRDVRSHLPGTRAARRALRLSVLLPAALLLVGGCDDIFPPDDEIPDPVDIRVINAATDEIRVRVDGESMGATSSGFFSARYALAEGAEEVRVEPSAASSLTGGVTITLPANGLGSGLGPTSILTTSTLAGAIEAVLLDDTDAIGQPGISRVRVIQGAGLHREIDIWYSNLNTPTLTRFKTPIQYGEITEFIETMGSSIWRIAVTPRMVPTPGENPEPQVIASINEFVGTQQAVTIVVLEDVGGGVRIVQRPMP